MRHIYVSASTACNSCERACRCVSDCPRAGRCVRHAQCVARAPHAYTCRTNRDLCHWLRSMHRRVYRRSAVPRVRIERTRTARVRLDTIFRSIVQRTLNGEIGDFSRSLIATTFSNNTFSLLSTETKFDISKIMDYRNFIQINIKCKYNKFEKNKKFSIICCPLLKSLKDKQNSYRKNDFAEICKNLARYRFENDFVRLLK